MVKRQDQIEAQYNKHPYPEPISNMDEYINKGYAQASCLDLIWHRLFPEKKYYAKNELIVSNIINKFYNPHICLEIMYSGISYFYLAST